MLSPLPVQTTTRRVLFVTSLVHLTNDACFALLYPLLPLIAADFHLSYTQVGLLKACFATAQSVFQIPVGVLGERAGEALILLVGNAWVGIGLGAMALAGGYGALLLIALLAGLGGNAQHPLANAIVSRAYGRARRATALGTLNFAGDVGKFIGPFAVGLIAVRWGWRPALVGVGGVTALFSLALLARRAAVLPVDTSEQGESVGATTADGKTRPGFPLLLLIGALDSATRGAALTFLPFLFARQGISAAAISALFSLIFGAGAAGKFLCGWLGDRWGPLAVILGTELVTAGALIGFIIVPVPAIIPLAIAFGFALNGTSSVLTAAVAHFIPAHRRARGYGAYFTASLVSSALAPLIYGVLGDATNLTTVFAVMAACTAAILLPLLPIRSALLATD
jgi:MFS transporter, FSR family, fosmidomycin resistance protein